MKNCQNLVKMSVLGLLIDLTRLNEACVNLFCKNKQCVGHCEAIAKRETIDMKSIQ